MMAGDARKYLIICCAFFAAAAGWPAHGEDPAGVSGDLSAALFQLADSASLELVVDPRLIAHKRAPALHRPASPEQALGQLLEGSGLSYRRVSGSTFVITAATPQTRLVESPSRLDPEPAIAEILVVGRTTQNVDIRRSPDDIQPYQVADSESIERAQPASTDDYLRNYLSSNTQAFSPSEQSASARSQIDLRGLGAAETLVLADGRRLASVPTQGDFLQSDLNALPVAGIGRIETLGATAGGIFGLGAAGGVVNVVMKRQFEGFDLGLVQGVSARADAPNWRLDGRVGYTSPGGGTRFMLRLSYSGDAGLQAADRSYSLDAREARNALVPGYTNTLVSNAINVSTTSGEPLTLVPAFGGKSLGASTTFLPIGAPALGAGGLSILEANAGRYDLALAPDGQGNLASIVSQTHTYSVISTLRQQVGGSLEFFVDYLRLVDWGRAITAGYDVRANVLEPGEVGNPFNEEVSVTFPTAGLVGVERERATTDRLTVGAILRLPHGWTANIDGALSRAKLTGSLSNYSLSTPIDAFSGPTVLAAQIAEGVLTNDRSEDVDRLYDGNVRLAGPVIRLPAGLVSATVTGEFRRETSPGQSITGDSGGLILSAPPRPQRQDVGSVFAEARLPLVSADSSFVPLRALEMQLAVRHDQYTISLPEFVSSDSVTSHGAVTAATFGVRVTPVKGLTFRTSYATGAVPPTPTQIIPFSTPAVFFNGYDDPKRGGPQSGGVDDTILVQTGGNPALRPQPVTTFTAGFIAEPEFIRGLRFSVDYSLISVRKQIVDYARDDIQYFIDNEALYPQRVVRSPLTSADITSGFTGGPIISVDESFLNTGRSTLQTVDFAADYNLSTPLGNFRAYGQVTWEPTLRRRDVLAQPSYNLVGHGDGPLAWRGNGGIFWTKGALSLGVDGQVYAGYTVADATPIFDAALLGSPFSKAEIAALRKAEPRIPAQAYINLSASLRSTLHLPAAHSAVLVYKFSVKDLTDKRPPVVANDFPGGDTYNFDNEQSGGFSPYGDPRGRRFEIGATIKY